MIRLLYFSGGSLISPDTILTAAHCIPYCRVHDTTAVVGTTNLVRRVKGSEEINAAAFIVHPGYNPSHFVNDIAIVKLEAKSKHRPVLLDNGKRQIEGGSSLTGKFLF